MHRIALILVIGIFLGSVAPTLAAPNTGSTVIITTNQENDGGHGLGDEVYKEIAVDRFYNEMLCSTCQRKGRIIATEAVFWVEGHLWHVSVEWQANYPQYRNLAKVYVPVDACYYSHSFDGTPRKPQTIPDNGCGAEITIHRLTYIQISWNIYFPKTSRLINA